MSSGDVHPREREEGVMPTRRMLSGVLAIVSILLAGKALALQVVLPASISAIIANPENPSETRVLVKYSVPEFLGTAEIYYAQLACKVDAVPTSAGGLLDVEATPVTCDWDAAIVSWSAPWRTAGGDADVNRRGSFVVRAGRQPIRIDVTDLVKQWASGERRNQGVMLRASGSFGGCFLLPRSAGDGGETLGWPVIRVWYLPRLR
jgi:hypothetical protein